MPTGFLSRFTGNNGGNTLEADLKKCTESGVIDVPKALFATIVEASQDADNRRVIMRHLCQCLSEPNHNKKWKRINAGLTLLEELTKKGSGMLLAETAHGHHFDLIQRLSFLENFDLDNDRRVQTMLRQKAKSLRTELLPKLQEMAETEFDADSSKDCASTSNIDGVSSISGITHGTTTTAASSTSYPSGFGSDDVHLAPYNDSKPKGPTVLNGIVRVGHRDDTSSDESDKERRSCKKQDSDSSFDSRGSRRRRQKKTESSDAAKTAAPAVNKPATVADLLEL